MRNKIKYIGAGLLALFALVGIAQAQFTQEAWYPNGYTTAVNGSGGWVTNAAAASSWTNPAGAAALWWTNAIFPQTGASTYPPYLTNRTWIGGGSKDLAIQFQADFPTGTVATNVDLWFTTSLDRLTNSFAGTATNETLNLKMLVAVAPPARVTFTTNLNFGALGNVGAIPNVYLYAIRLGYTDGYMTNYTLKVFPK